MRFILTIIIWIVIVGGLWLYDTSRKTIQSVAVKQGQQALEAQELYSLQITPTFSIEPDPFALQSDGENPSAMVVKLNGMPIPIKKEALERGKPWKLERVAGLVQGHNELFVQASPPLGESDRDHGVRVQLIKAGAALVDKTLWSEEGALVSGAIHFEVERQGDDKHDH